ncbi:hypothetical protein [Helicobacter ibis]|uniref:Ferrochelatase n=1 Tax=Helicobacter ibis TaxID=2962633 RepID=A0ABT4VBH6_9HELI|nr:hypothetical protein [Helicobacter ibis]MDA3968063.1 hypothetical protein [Helicobacter ibis]
MKKGNIQIGVNEVVEITFGTLLNKPSISFFNRICDDVEQVTRGDLFVAFNANDINLAIERGAFGILFSEDIAITDNEVAWICVANIEQAITKLLRHYLIVKSKILFLLSSDEYDIASCILNQNKKIAYFNGGFVQLLQFVIETESAYVMYRYNGDFLLNEIEQEAKILDDTKIDDDKLPFSINSFSLFGIKIFYKSLDYSLQIPKLFIQPLSRIIKLADEYCFSVKLDNLNGISSFRPLYLDERGYISQPGTTNKVVLSCEDVKLYEQYLAYFAMYAKWAKLILFVPKIYHELYTPYADVICYEDNDRLFDELIHQKYNFALILGISSDMLEKRFTKEDKEISLFDL